jgi:hypothetical protein
MVRLCHQLIRADCYRSSHDHSETKLPQGCLTRAILAFSVAHPVCFGHSLHFSKYLHLPFRIQCNICWLSLLPGVPSGFVGCDFIRDLPFILLLNELLDRVSLPLSHWAAILLGSFIVYWVGWVICPGNFHPLASITPLWYQQALRNRYHDRLQLANHEKCGPFVHLTQMTYR